MMREERESSIQAPSSSSSEGEVIGHVSRLSSVLLSFLWRASSDFQLIVASLSLLTYIDQVGVVHMEVV